MPEHLLPFAAIGTIADLVPLKDENRLIVQKGLILLRETENVGLHALLKLAGVDQSSLMKKQLAFLLHHVSMQQAD